MGNQSKATISLIESDELLNAVESAVGELLFNLRRRRSIWKQMLRFLSQG